MAGMPFSFPSFSLSSLSALPGNKRISVRSESRSATTRRTYSKAESAQPDTQRLVHPALLVDVLGACLGSAVTLAVTSFILLVLDWGPLLAVCLGTTCNQVCHVAYYSFLFVIRDTRGMPSVFVQLLEYAMVAAGGTGLLALFHFFLPLNFEASVFFSIGVLSFLNILLVRVSPLGSARLAHVEYRDMPGTFYDDQTDFTQVGRFRAWFHVSRFQKLKRFVATYYKPGMQIADLGCGNCWWNTDQWPVTGVDTNWRMVSWALQHGRLQAYRISDDLAATRLPDKSFDVVVMSETLEHLFNLKDVLREVRRILKDDGHFLITIPYDIFLGPFFVLFNLNCVYQGYVKGSKYHRYRCGHIHHFSVRRLRSALAEVGLRLEKFHIVNGLTLFARAVKSQVQPITNSSLVRPR